MNPLYFKNPEQLAFSFKYSAFQEEKTPTTFVPL